MNIRTEGSAYCKNYGASLKIFLNVTCGDSVSYSGDRRITYTLFPVYWLGFTLR